MAAGIYTPLLEDAEIDDAIKAGTDLKQSLREALSSRKTTLANLRKMKQEVEESYDKSRKARIGGTTATITGSILTIIGFGLGFVTLGASLGLSIAGGLLAAAGGVIIAGAEIGYYAVSRNTLKQAQNACDVDRDLMKKVENNGKKFTSCIESLAKKHNTSSDVVYEIIKFMWQGGVNVGIKVTKGLYCGYKLFDGVADAGRVAYRAVKVGKTAALGARMTFTGLRSVTGIARVSFVALDVVFIPIDLAVMMKSAYDVHKYRTGQGSNSAVANEIGKLISDLEEHEQKMKDNLKELESSY